VKRQWQPGKFLLKTTKTGPINQSINHNPEGINQLSADNQSIDQSINQSEESIN
jgi:hypothetical protein